MVQIGDILYGGVIFYVDMSGEHGLVASIKNQTRSQWGCQNTFIDDTKTGLSTYPDDAIGLNNTILITTRCLTINIAAKFCREYKGEGYNDWFLPSKDELNLMYLNIKKYLSPNYYWSSSEIDNRLAWQQHFRDGTQCKIFKSIEALISPIRAF